MSEAIESIGDAVTGGIVARAVEPGGGGAPAGAAGPCLNCGSDLQGDYCHRCGQKGRVHRTLGGFGHDVLHGVFHFEGKIWRTLPMLFLRPGTLTRRYVEGERALRLARGALPVLGVPHVCGHERLQRRNRF